MGPLRLDLHVHAQHSPDSALTLERIVARLAAAGLNGFALTDHNTVDGHAELSSLQTRFPQLLLVPGIELSTTEGHLLAYGITIPPPSHRPVAETIQWVRERGGVSVLSHPFRHSHGVGRAIAESACVTAIETVNGHNSPGANRRAAEVAARRRLGTTGGSDAHQPEDLGRAYTEFPESTRTVEAVLEALRRGQVTAHGRSLTTAGRLAYEWRTAMLRVRRGFRPI